MSLTKPPRKSLMKSNITSTYEVPQPASEDHDASTPAEPPRKSLTNSTITSSYEVIQAFRKDLDASPPIKPPRKSLMNSSTSTQIITSPYEVHQPSSENPDTSTPPSPCESPAESEIKPVPRPRSKILPKAQSNTNNTDDSVDENGNTTNAVSSQMSQQPAEQPRPVRPPPPLAKCLSASKPAMAVDRESKYMSLSTATTAQPSVDSNEGKQKLPRPERPPPPAKYYDRPPSMKGGQCQNDTRESRRSTTTTPQQSPTLSEEEVNLFGTYREMATDNTERPVVPPRQSGFDSPPPQTRPPPPTFNPPPPPSESTYSVIEYRPYLDVLPEDEDRLSPSRTIPRSGLRYQSGSFTSRQQTTHDAEDIIVMLRWLARMSKSDYMTPSLYGLSIEEEIRSFTQRAAHVCKALRLYNLLMMKRNENLRNILSEFNCISDSLDKLKKKTKTMGIAGGTTGAVGGVAAVLGIALAPATLGASLIATAVGAGMVASAGGMGAHTAKANKKTVNKMKVEKLVYEYKSNIIDPEHCLDFILSGMNELRRHDIPRLQRAGAQVDALKTAHLSQTVFKNNLNIEKRTSVSHPGALTSERLLLAFVKELDEYFTEEGGQKLKKSNKSRFSGRVRLLAKNLHDQLEYMNRMWEMFS